MQNRPQGDIAPFIHLARLAEEDLVKEICLSTSWPVTLLQEQHPECSHGICELRELRELRDCLRSSLAAHRLTWQRLVPRPPVIVEPPEVLNTSVKTLVAYAALIMWLPLLIPLLVWALMGDLILNLHGQEATKKLAEGLLPLALISTGVWGDAEKLLQNSPWPLRCSFSLHLVAFVIFLRSLCGAGRRQRWRDEAKDAQCTPSHDHFYGCLQKQPPNTKALSHIEDVSRYRNALCYARLKGSRVEPEAPMRAAEAQAAHASLPAQDPTIRERAPVAKWRKSPAALPASSGPGMRRS
eukprot:s204_g2.t1